MEKNNKELQDGEKPKLPLAFKVGMVFILLSPLRYLLLMGLPWLPYSRSVKLGLGSGIFIVAEILFWVGAFLVGEEVVRKYKEHLNIRKYFKRKAKSNDKLPLIK